VNPQPFSQLCRQDDLYWKRLTDPQYVGISCWAAENVCACDGAIPPLSARRKHFVCAAPDQLVFGGDAIRRAVDFSLPKSRVCSYARMR
jgi:hypothetical protein